MTSKFRLGQIVGTPGALNILSQDETITMLSRHAQADWGNVDNEDKKSNNRAIAHEGNLDRQERVISSYMSSHGEKIWIITESDRSVTTILLPDEY